MCHSLVGSAVARVLPRPQEYEEMAERSGYSLEKIKQRVHDLQVNPMMGHRGKPSRNYLS